MLIITSFYLDMIHILWIKFFWDLSFYLGFLLHLLTLSAKYLMLTRLPVKICRYIIVQDLNKFLAYVSYVHSEDTVGVFFPFPFIFPWKMTWYWWRQSKTQPWPLNEIVVGTTCLYLGLTFHDSSWWLLTLPTLGWQVSLVACRISVFHNITCNQLIWITSHDNCN